VQASAASDNIEDCQWHTFRIVWNAVTKTITVYFDGTQRLTATVDMVATYFNNDPNVYWGFTAATGGANNLQQFCTALNPDFTTNFANNAACNGTPVIFTDNSAAFTTIQSWRWDFGDGAISTLQNPPAHLYSSPGTYQVKLVITGLDGCVSDTMRKTITIGSKPVADFQVFDTCDGKALRIINQSSNAVGLLNQWTWMLDGSVVSSDQQPVITVQSAGLHTLKLIVKSNIGCESDTVTKQVMIAAAPVVDINAENGCINQPISFSAFQTGPPAGIVQWNWSFGDGGNAQVQNPVHVYSAAGNVTVQLTAIAVNGCGSDVVLKTIHVDSLSARTINDTTILPNLPFLLSVNISGSFNGQPAVAWSPSAGLSNSSITNPVATLQDDMTYIITATSAAGCTARDTVNIKVFKGSAVYVPTGFTPNADGRNDFLRGLYIGIIKVDYFKVYNRWGQLIFNTNSLADGWDGTIKGVKQPAGTYVWMVRAVDLAGKVYEMKGTSTLIR
jgi:gliding motility-associated-like protein